MRIAAIAYLLLLAAAALADTPAAAPADESATLGEIVVTGSHIRAVDIETQHPIIVLDRAAIDRTGLTSISDVVDLVVAGGESLNRNINNGGNGEQLVNLRSLGFNRTLVLLNGQRFVSDIGGAVDLSAIPFALVERIEVLLDSASAIYGSDAIAGVVNIVTRRNYEGGEFGMYFGENDYDDGARRAFDVSFGRKGDAWSVSGGLEYSKDDPIFAGNRAISAVPYFGLPPGATGSTATPYSWLKLDSGATLRLIDGHAGTSPDDFRPVSSYHDRYNFAGENYLQSPQQRRAVFAQARYEFSPALAANIDTLYNERRSTQQLAPPVLRLNAFDVFDVPLPDAIAISANNVYNPFGEPVDITARRLVEGGQRVQQQTVGTLRVHAGLDGLFHLFQREFTWGADAVATRARLRDRDGPYGDDRKLALAVGPSFRDASGTPRCGTPDAPIDGCVPFDLFGPPGSITPQMLAYATTLELNRSRSDSRVFEVHASSDRLADLPSGPLAVAAGLEYRRESAADIPDPLRASGNENGNGVSAESTGGEYSVAEAYLELDAPLLVERPFARQLDFVLSTRYSHYSNFGDTTNSQIGLRWRPIDDLLVRANVAQGFRAPAITELFQGAVRGHDALLADPCDPASDVYADVAARCAALGVPANVDSSTQVAAFTDSGNRDLQPETSRSRGVGFVYAPAWLQGFDLSVDWYDIRLHAAIVSTGDQDVVDGCYLFNNDADCALITRSSADGTIAHVTTKPQNLPEGLETSGYDLALHYRRDTPIGRLRLDANANRVLYFGEIGHPAPGTVYPDGNVAFGNGAGLSLGGLYNATWRWRSQLSLGWERGSWSASITGRYFSHLDENCIVVTRAAHNVGDSSLRALCSAPDTPIPFGDTTVPKNRVASITFTDLETAWEAPWRGRVSVGVRNAFDRDPPVAYSAFANSFLPDYDVPGRFFYASYRQKF